MTEPVRDDTHTPEPPDPGPWDNVTPLHTGPTSEQALLGAILTEPRLLPQVTNLLTGNDFEQPRHEAIWNAITALADQGTPPDPLTVHHQLQTTNATLYNRNGGAVYLHTLISTCPNPLNAPHYANQVRNEAKIRRVHQTATRLALITTGDDIDQIIERSVEEIYNTATYFGPTAGAQLHADLTWLLDGQPPHVDPPTYVRRTAGGALFYPGRVNGIYGDPESAKSWIAQVAIVEALTTGQKAALIDVDHNGPELTTERLLALGATPTQLADPNQFRYHAPDDGPELMATINHLVAWTPALAVLDSIGEIMPMLGIKSVDNDELSTALRTTATALANTGACVICVDHLPKSTEARTSGYAIGGTAKKRAIDGSYIHAEAKTPPAPGGIGRIMLRIEKDRPGRLRATCTGKYIGTFILDSTHPQITVSIDNDTPVTPEGKFRPTGAMEAICRYVEDHDQATFREIKANTNFGDKTLKAAIERLHEEGYMSLLPGRNRSIIHHVTGIYREADDDQN